MTTPIQQPLTVAYSGQVEEIWGGNSPGLSIQIYNPDINNTVYVGYVRSITSGSINAIPLGPGQGITIDGGTSIYGIAAAGTTATVVIPGGASFFQCVTQAMGQLFLSSIQSPNYVHNVSGWTIQKNGNVEFNSGTFRGTITAGTFQGTDFVINSSGAFFYSGTPASGNLIASIAASSGTDAEGNAYLEGTVGYSNTGATWSATQVGSGSGVGEGLTFYWSTSAAGPYTPMGSIGTDASQNLYLVPSKAAGGYVAIGGVGGTNPLLLPTVAGAVSLATLGTQLYADSATGALAALTNLGQSGNIPVVQTDTSTKTIGNTATPGALSATYTIKAGDASTGTEYIIEVPFSVNTGQTTGETLAFGWSINGGTATTLATIGSAWAGQNVTYVGNVNLHIRVMTTGTGGTYNAWLTGGAWLNGGNIGGTTNTVSITSPISTGHAINTTNNNTFTLFGTWGGTGGSDQTISTIGSTFIRRGP